jgi:hypothetical protein
MIMTTIIQFKGVIGNLAVVLLGPYLVWVTYASALTIWIWQHNKPVVARKVSKAMVWDCVVCNLDVPVPHVPYNGIVLVHGIAGVALSAILANSLFVQPTTQHVRQQRGHSATSLAERCPLVTGCC